MTLLIINSMIFFMSIENLMIKHQTPNHWLLGTLPTSRHPWSWPWVPLGELVQFSAGQSEDKNYSCGGKSKFLKCVQNISMVGIRTFLKYWHLYLKEHSLDKDTGLLDAVHLQRPTPSSALIRKQRGLKILHDMLLQCSINSCFLQLSRCCGELL